MMTAKQLAAAAGVSEDWFYRNYNKILAAIDKNGWFDKYAELPDGTYKFNQNCIEAVQKLAIGGGAGGYGGAGGAGGGVLLQGGLVGL